MKDTIFKKGDKVFDLHHGWGIVHEIDCLEGYLFPIRCNFNNLIVHYTHDGRPHFNNPKDYTNYIESNYQSEKTLSFTEYKLDGFSQERPENLPKLGEVVWVRDRDNEDWIVRHFLRKIEVKYLAIEDNPETYIFSEYDLWDKMTTENPYMK